MAPLTFIITATTTPQGRMVHSQAAPMATGVTTSDRSSSAMSRNASVPSRYADPHEGMAEEGQGGHDAPPPAGEGRLRQRAASRRPLRQGQGHADASADRCAEEHAEGRVGVAPLVLGHGYLPRHGAGTACAAPLEDARDRSAP
jgi:hypothetical protein